jgi:hypothetical protein
MGALDMVQACGRVGYLLLVLGTLGVLASFAVLIALVAAPKKRIAFAGGAICLVLGVAILTVASLGTFLARRVMDRALENEGSESIDPSQAARIRAEGYREAAACMPVGVLSSSMPIFAGAAALIVAFARKDE